MMDELIKRLREDVPTALVNCDFDFVEGWSKEAADAIEELSRDLDSMNEANIALYGALPKWIPVTERLPEKEEMVIFHYAWTGMSGTVYKEVTLATLAELEHIGGKPLAWMPLPEPPKEE